VIPGIDYDQWEYSHMPNVQLVISCSKDIAIPFEHDLQALPAPSHNAIPQRIAGGHCSVARKTMRDTA
jgi:hypothetical protein